MENNKKECQQVKPEDIIEKIKNAINNENFLKSIGIFNIEKSLKILFDTVIEDIENIKNDKNVGLSVGRLQKFNNVYNFFDDFLVHNKIKQEFLAFVNDFNFLISNWYFNLIKVDEEVNKNDNIIQKINKVDSLMNMNLTLRELLSLIKNEVNIIRSMRTHEVPAFKLSQHYLDVLNGE